MLNLVSKCREFFLYVKVTEFTFFSKTTCDWLVIIQRNSREGHFSQSEQLFYNTSAAEFFSMSKVIYALLLYTTQSHCCSHLYINFCAKMPRGRSKLNYKTKKSSKNNRADNFKKKSGEFLACF